MVKTPGRHRKREDSCPQFLRSTWPTIHSDNEDLTLNDMTSFITAVKTKRIVPVPYSAEWFRQSQTKALRNSRHPHYGRRTPRSTIPCRTTSTPILRSIGDTDDTEDESTMHVPRCVSTSISSHGSCDYLQRQATSLGSLTSSQSSLGERSTNTDSPMLEDGFPFMKRATSSASLEAILDYGPRTEYETDLFNRDQKMKEVVQDIVSPKALRKTELPIPAGISSSFSRGSSPMVQEDQKSRVCSSVPNLTAVDPSILVLLPRPASALSSKIAEPFPEKYSPTALCDMSEILSRTPSSTDIVIDPRSDLAMLRAGTSPVNEEESDNQTTRLGWDIPEDDKDMDILTCLSRIPYRKLSESSVSSTDELEDGQNVGLLEDQDSICSSSVSRSTSLSHSSGVHDLSDYLADISSEEGCTQLVFVWPPCSQLRLHFDSESEPFVLFPRIPGVAYYGTPSDMSSESPGHISQGINAFFNSRSIMHRLGPHGHERVYDEELCPERCGFAFPVPPQIQVTKSQN